MVLLLLTRTERMWHTIPFNFGAEPTIYINVSSGSQPWIGCTMYIGELQLHTTTTTISYRVLAKLKYRKWTNKSVEKRKLHAQNCVQTEKFIKWFPISVSTFRNSLLDNRWKNGVPRMWCHFPLNSNMKMVKNLTIAFFFYFVNSFWSCI